MPWGVPRTSSTELGQRPASIPVNSWGSRGEALSPAGQRADGLRSHRRSQERMKTPRGEEPRGGFVFGVRCGRRGVGGGSVGVAR